MSQYFILRNRQVINNCVAFVSALGTGEKIWSVTVKPYVKNRSLAQNRCFHAFVGELALHKGYSAAQMKILVKHHLGLHEYVTNKKTGEVIPSLRSTADLNVDEMAHLITQVEVLAAKDGILLHRDADYFEAMSLERDGQTAAGRGVPSNIKDVENGCRLSAFNDERN